MADQANGGAMSSNGLLNTAELTAIAALALDVHDLEKTVKIRRADYVYAIMKWKLRAGNSEHVDRDKGEWHEMLQASDQEYGVLTEARRRAANARRRLGTAIRTYERGRAE